MKDFAVQATGISKTYSRTSFRLPLVKQPQTTRPAVFNVSLSVTNGELFGLLGPNGAGKTTLVKILCTLIIPDNGQAWIGGHPLRDGRAIRAVTGLVVSDERSFYWRLTTGQNLRFFAALQGLHGRVAEGRVAAVLADVRLADRVDQRFSDLSSGMRQRLAIARALLHEPRVLFLDEPTRSLDPVATARLHDLLQTLQQEKNLSIILITHDLSEAEKMCERVALMHDGRIAALGAPAELRAAIDPRHRYVITIGALTDSARAALQTRPLGDILIDETGVQGLSRLRFTAGENDGLLAALLGILQREGVPILAVDGAPPTLEEAFAHYTARLEDETR